MADREIPYDPYIPQGGAAGASAGREGNQRTAALQAVGELEDTSLFGDFPGRLTVGLGHLCFDVAEV